MAQVQIAQRATNSDVAGINGTVQVAHPTGTQRIKGALNLAPLRVKPRGPMQLRGAKTLFIDDADGGIHDRIACGL